MFVEKALILQSTKEKSPIRKTKTTMKLYVDNIKYEYRDNLNFNIYILSDEGIKEGDWYYDHMYRLVFKATDTSTHKGGNNYKKIIATTDRSLIITDHVDCDYPLPYVAQSFIEEFIEEYNNGNTIIKVMVEYEELYKDECGNWLAYNKEFWDKIENKPKFETKIQLKIDQNNNVNLIKS